MSDTSDHTSGLKIAPRENEELERKAVRKLDLTVLPILTLFYLLSFLDRANIGNARVAGLQSDLGLSDHQYQICVTVLYVPYILAEMPANLLLRKIGPKLLMPTLLTTWGVMVTLQGLVSSFPGLVVVRALLGLVEGPMFPGIVLYLSGFYTRKELSLRIALFFSAASLSGAFSGLLAAAIQNMHGVGGKAGWAWIFILEGLFTVIIGVIGFFVIPSDPRGSKFLTDEEKDFIVDRLERDRPYVRPDEKFTPRQMYYSLTSPHVAILFVVFFMIGTTLYGLALFTPSIINQLGFSPTKSQLLSVGPFGAGFFVSLICAFWSDRFQSRGPVAAALGMLSIAGFALFLEAKNKFASYGALYLMIPGIYAPVPILTAWMSNNSEPHYRRATTIALAFIGTNSGGILSTWRYPTKEGPRFRKTTIMNLTFSVFVVVGILLNMAYLSWKNKQRTQPEYRAKVLQKFGEDEKDNEKDDIEQWVELGDRHPDFRYNI